MKKISRKNIVKIAFCFVIITSIVFYSGSFIGLYSNVLTDDEKRFFICSQDSLKKNTEKYTSMLEEKNMFLNNIAFSEENMLELLFEKILENGFIESLNFKMSELEKNKSVLHTEIKNLEKYIRDNCENQIPIKTTECRRKRRDLTDKESAIKRIISKINYTTKTTTEKKMIALTIE